MSIGSFQLGQTHFWVGFLRWEQGDLDAALEQFQAYQQISRHLLDRDPENADWQLELAYSHSNVGQILEERAAFAEAAAALEASAQIFEGLTSGRTDGDPLIVELAHVYAKLGKLSVKA